jgi:hypothetical protein
MMHLQVGDELPSRLLKSSTNNFDINFETANNSVLLLGVVFL